METKTYEIVDSVDPFHIPRMMIKSYELCKEITTRL